MSVDHRPWPTTSACGVMAEGRTEEAWDLLVDLQCDVAQGFYLSRPMPASEVPRWVRAWSAGRGTQSQRPAVRARGG